MTRRPQAASLARREAAQLMEFFQSTLVPSVMRMVLIDVVARPDTSSDTLLILSDALTEAADAERLPRFAQDLRELAKRLAALAPRRAL